MNHNINLVFFQLTNPAITARVTNHVSFRVGSGGSPVRGGDG